jgi:hypothetical protein
MRVRFLLAAASAVAATITGLPAATPVDAASADREPALSPGIEWVAHRDNPFRHGDDPDYINSDLAFTGDHLIQGNYNGFSVWDIANPADPQLLAAVNCPGGQGDVSAVGDLVILSVDETMSSDRCDATRVPETVQNWDGIRVFDVSDPRNPEYVAAVQTRCGSHTHTVVPDPTSPDHVFVYVSAYSRGASQRCTGRNPLQIVEIGFDDPSAAAIVGELDLFDESTAFGPGDRVPGGADTRSTTGCHEITAYPAKGLAIAGCRGDGLLLSIADPLSPEVLQRIRDPNVAFWHSGIFNNDASSVVFQDELGDGFINTCSPRFGPDRGADAVWALTEGVLELRGYYKLPRSQADVEKCVAHTGALVPVPGRFIIAQAWLEGGVSVVDLTDPAAPVELAWFDRPDHGYSMEYTAGIWSVYHYNGYLYASDMYEGLEVLRLTDPLFADAARYSSSQLNPQTQPAYDWVWREAPLVPTDAAERESIRTVVVSPDIVPPGDTDSVTVSLPAGSLEPGETADVWWADTGTVLATVTAGSDGSLAATSVQPPGPLAAGEHDLLVRGDRSAPRLALGVLMVGEAATATAEPGTEPGGGPAGSILLIVALGVLAVAAAAVAAGLARRRPGRSRS